MFKADPGYMNNANTTIPLRIAELMVGFFRNTLTQSENEELEEWLHRKQENIEGFDRVAEIAFRPSFGHRLYEPQIQITKHKKN